MGKYCPYSIAILSSVASTLTTTLTAMDVNFRKIDVDQYDEDVLLDSELYEADPRDPAQILDDTKQKASAVRSSLSKYARGLLYGFAMSDSVFRGDILGALELVLTDAPYGPNVDEAKVRVTTRHRRCYIYVLHLIRRT